MLNGLRSLIWLSCKFRFARLFRLLNGLMSLIRLSCKYRFVRLFKLLNWNHFKTGYYTKVIKITGMKTGIVENKHGARSRVWFPWSQGWAKHRHSKAAELDTSTDQNNMTW